MPWMGRSPKPHPDPVVRDLQAIRRLNWAEPEGFGVMEVLLDHPLVVFVAEGSRTRKLDRVDALRRVLERLRAQIARQEKKNPPALDRSLALASGALLRLDPQFATAKVESLREHVARHWKSHKGELTTDGFRQHLEILAFYEPFAGAFLNYAVAQAQRHGFALVEDGGYGSLSEEDAKRGLGPVAQAMCDIESDSYHKRLNAIRHGALLIRSREEMLRFLGLLTSSAQQELQAVDRIDIEEWFNSVELSAYLKMQLGRCQSAGIKLERIRLVGSSELDDERGRDQLTEFIRMHDEASASLLLCPLRRAEELDTPFYPKMGLLMMDARDVSVESVAVTGWIGGGRIERAMVYTRVTDAVLDLRQAYEKLRTCARSNDQELRARLARARA